MSHHPLYRITSIGRPVEPQYPTNKAVLIILPLAGIVAALLAYFLMGETTAAGLLRTALLSILVAFGSWALARELAPDDNPAAFISMGTAYLVFLFSPGGSILLLFVALALSRILNRSTGLAPRLSDSVVVAVLAAWAAYSLESPLVAVVAAAAFVLDASLPGPERRQWPFAVVSIAVAVALAMQYGMNVSFPAIPETTEALISPLVLLSFILVAVSMQTVDAPGDVDGHPLLLPRVKWGMLITFLLALVFLFAPPGQSGLSTLLVATMAGIPAGKVLRSVRGFA